MAEAPTRYRTLNLWTILADNGQKMTWLAAKAQVSRQLLYEMKRGETNVTLATAERIACAMRLPVSALFLPIESTPSIENRSVGSDVVKAAD